MEGGPSHIDLFDPKPELNELAGKPLPAELQAGDHADGRVRLAAAGLASGSGSSTARAGSGSPTGCRTSPTCVDDLAVIRSCWAERAEPRRRRLPDEHRLDPRRPALAGELGELRPGHREPEPARLRRACRTTRRHGRRRPAQLGHRLHAGRLPGDALPRRRRADPQPRARPTGVGATAQRGKLDFLDQLNRRHAEPRPEQTELDARISSYELAFRMQAEAPEAVDLAQRDRRDPARSTAWTTRRPRASAASACWPAGWSSAACGSSSSTAAPGSQWDAHRDIERNHAELCRAMDQPVAGLLKDLKRRGLLDETLVVWGGEFGRTPMSEKGDGRDHNPYGFTMWMAGGGVKGGHGRRRDRRGRPARRRGPGPRPRPPRHDPPLPRPRPHPARSTATRAAPNGRPSTRGRCAGSCWLECDESAVAEWAVGSRQ